MDAEQISTRGSVDSKPLSTAWQSALGAADGQRSKAMNNKENNKENKEKKRVVRKGPIVQPKAPRALLCLTLKNPIRKFCLDVVEWKYPFQNPKFDLQLI